MKLELLSLTKWTLTGALLIGAVAALRLLLASHKPSLLPQFVWPLLWWLVALRLLLPFNLPCAGSVQNFWSTQDSPKTTYYNVNYFAQQPGAEVTTTPTDYIVQTEQNHASEPAPAFNLWLFIWAAGTIRSAAFFALVYLRSRRLFHKNSAPPDWPFSFFIQQWLKTHSLPSGRKIRVCQTSAVNAPLTYGLLRPVILIPSSIFADKQLDLAKQKALHYALLHEWTHIRHCDAAAKLLAATALCLHWFNPAVWLFFWLFSRDLELACDEGVVRHAGNTPETRRNYALALLSWAQNQSNPLYSNFSIRQKRNQATNPNVITERIVAIMNVKKVSILGTAAACLLLVCTGLAFATNAAKPQEPVFLEAADANGEPIDSVSITNYANMSDEELHQLFSEHARINWATRLAPYEQFGLTWSFDDPDWDGNGLTMYYQGREVRGIWDETQGMWITEHAGDNGFAPDAVELHTVYTNGQLSGLRFADAEEQKQWDEQRRQPSHYQIIDYEPFGLAQNDEGRLVYNGQLVRYFWDGYEIFDNDQLLGRAIHFEYVNLQSGEIDLRTRRSVIQNADGSTDPFGELLGVEVYTESNINDMTTPPLQAVTYSVMAEDKAVDAGLTFAERLAPYAQYGLEYHEQVMSDGTHRDIYYNGELIALFVDHKPYDSRGGGHTFTMESTTKLSDVESVVLTEYDEQGQLTGLRLATPEEVNMYLDNRRHKTVHFLPGYDENGEGVLYATTDGGTTYQTIKKPQQ